MTSEQFVHICKKYGIDITNQQYEQFVLYYQLMVEENTKYNLTAIVDNNEVFYKHFLDSILPVMLINDNSSVVDIGCGAGFPSVPLKIINNSLRFTLIDSVAKKVNFVNNLITNHLKLNNINAIHTRIEDFAHKCQYRESYDYCVSRAVAPLRSLLEYAIPLIKTSGQFIVYKGSNVDIEINEANNAINKLNCKLVKRLDIHIEEINSDRTILIFEKNGYTSASYPRLQNKVRKMPL